MISVRLFLSWIVPVRYRPGGKTTSPPPAAAQASIALLIAAVSSVFPSPTAPSSRTLTANALDEASRIQTTAKSASMHFRRRRYLGAPDAFSARSNRGDGVVVGGAILQAVI